MNKKKREDLKKRQYPLYLTAKQKQNLDSLYQVFLNEYDGDITFQVFLRTLILKGAKYFKIKYAIKENKQEREEKQVDISDFDIDKIVGDPL